MAREKPPHRVLAAPEVPAPEAFHRRVAAYLLPVLRLDVLGIGIGAEIAVGVLKRNEAKGLLVKPLFERTVVLQRRRAARRDHQLAPELALPHAERPLPFRRVVERVVIRLLERGTRLREDDLFREIASDAMVEEAVELLAHRPGEARMPRRNGRQAVGAGGRHLGRQGHDSESTRRQGNSKTFHHLYLHYLFPSFLTGKTASAPAVSAEASRFHRQTSTSRDVRLPSRPSLQYSPRQSQHRAQA